MKELIILAVAALVLAIASHANAWTLKWDPSTGTVDGYLVEISTDDGVTWPYLYQVIGGTTELPLDDKCQYLQKYSFRVSAWNAAGVSEPCPALSWTRPSYVPPAQNPLPEVNIGPAPEVVVNPNVVE